MPEDGDVTCGAVIRSQYVHILIMRHSHRQLPLVHIQQADGSDHLDGYTAELSGAVLEVGVVLVEGPRVLRDVLDRDPADTQHHPASTDGDGYSQRAGEVVQVVENTEANVCEVVLRISIHRLLDCTEMFVLYNGP